MIARLLLLIVLIGVAVYVVPLAVQPSARTPVTSPTPGPSSATVVASGMASIDGALKQAAQTGKAVPIAVRLSDADLTAAARPYFPQSYAGITVADPSVRIGSALRLTATASSLLFSGALVADATPYASNGRLAVRLDSASVAGFALPDAARTQLEQQLQTAVNSAIPSKLQVTSVALTPGAATISGSALP